MSMLIITFMIESLYTLNVINILEIDVKIYLIIIVVMLL